MSTPAFACAALEIALNRYLALEPQALVTARLRGRVFALRVQPPGWTFVVECLEAGVRVAPSSDAEPDVAATASPAALLSMLRKLAAGDGGLPAGVTVQGDATLLQRFAAMLAGIGFDPAEWLAPLLGDGAAHRATTTLRSVFGGLLDWGRKTADTVSLDAAEYLREETRDLARVADVADWSLAVERLREAADRAEARLQRLERGAQASDRAGTSAPESRP